MEQAFFSFQKKIFKKTPTNYCCTAKELSNTITLLFKGTNPQPCAPSSDSVVQCNAQTDDKAY